MPCSCDRRGMWDSRENPLIKELQELWKGVWTKDAATGTHFQMKAAVLWTINDFPARSSLSGWSGQGYYACPTCNEDTPSMAVKSKIVYVGHRRFLRTKHPLRSKFKEFYGFPEPKPKPRKFTEMDIQLQISKVFKRFPGKHPDIAKKNPKPNRKIELNWSKRSIFWDLEYWPFLLLKNNLDVMHIEKNALEALLNTLLQNDKSKDTLKARQDLETLIVQKELWWMFPFERGSITEGYVAEEALVFCSRYLKVDVEMRFNRLGRNDDGFPEEEPYKFQAVVWFVLNNSPEVDADILAYREESPDNVETSFPAWFNYKVNTLDILPWSYCSSKSVSDFQHPGLMERCEEILELTYVSHRKVVLFRCKWLDTINPKNHTTRNRRSYIDQGIHHILTDREFHKNNQYILATQATQVFYLEDLARQPRGWKVVEHVYHRDVAESDQDVIHGSSSSHVTLSVGLTCLEHTDLSINAQSTEVDAPPVNEDNADFINNEDDVVAHVLDDDDVEVSDDDEVNPSTNVEEMACVAPRSHGGDAGGSPPRRPNRPVPAQCQSSMLRLETGNKSLRKAFRENNEQPLQLGFDYDDLGTFHPIGNFASMLNSLMGETIRPLPLACEWEEIPEAFKAHIYPTLESHFNIAEWYNNQDKVVVESNVYTVGERVRLGLDLKLRLLWRKNKNRIKADHYAKHDSPEEAKNHPPPPRVWGDRTQDNWNELVDWWSHPDRVSRSLQNAANRAKNTIITHQGKKSFAQGRNEYKVEKGHYEDLIETWRKGHSSKKTGEFKTEKNKQRYLDMKAMQDKIKGPHPADEADQRANVAYQNTESIYGALAQRPHYTLLTNPHMNDSRSCDQLAQDLARENNNECSLGEEEEGEQQLGDDYSEEEEEE
ncbi:hypothetical protein Tco_0138037 [Tanacetum coccineum]